MGFEQLPTELQIEIFDYLEGSDLKSARSVCTKFRDNAAPALYRCIIACARYQAMGAFQKISLHPVYAKYVKEIRFDASVFDAALARNEGLYILEADKFESLQHGFHWEKRQRWRRYRELYDEQEDIRASGVLLQTVSRALEWLPNVATISYSPGPHTIPIEAKTVRDLIPRGSIVGHRADDAHSSTLYHGFHHLIGATYFSQYSGIRNFRALPKYEGRPGAEFRLAIFDFPEEGSLDAGQYFFSHLQKVELEMSLMNRYHSPGPEALKQLSNLATLLSRARQLQHLALHVRHWRSSSESMHSNVFSPGQSLFAHFGLNTMWPMLQSLSLQGIYADEKEFMGLMTRHQTTLTALEFKACSLYSGHWSEIVDEVIYNTKIMPFSLDGCNETVVGGVEFRNLSAQESALWRYEGRVCLKNGERCYDEDTESDKKSVYAWRSHPKDQAHEEV